MEERQNQELPENSNFNQSLVEIDGAINKAITSKRLEVNLIGFNSVYQSIKEASTTTTNQRFIKLFNPIFFVVWGFYLVALAKVVRNIKNQLSVESKYKDDFHITGPETIYTASKKSFEGTMPMRFFGIRFLAIWVLPVVITGTVMEFLFVSPLRGVSPFT